MTNAVQQAVITERDELKRGTSAVRLALFNDDGSPFEPGGISASDAVDAVAEKSQIAAVTAVAATNGAQASGANPTKAEYDAVVALANELKTKFNALLAAIKA